MTKTEDKIAQDAAKAAQLIKQTAETTATALNIQYIQKDISEIKDNFKILAQAQDGKVEELQQQVNTLSKIVYMGLGASWVIEIGLRFFVK